MAQSLTNMLIFLVISQKKYCDNSHIMLIIYLHKSLRIALGLVLYYESFEAFSGM